MRPRSPRSVDLRTLVEMFGLAPAGPGDAGDLSVTGVAMASSEVQPGDLYLGVPGARVHGASFSADAVSRGAVAIVTDAEGAALAADSSVPVLVTPVSPRDIAGAVAAKVYGTDAPPESILTLGVTGTNGKTSTAHILDGLLQQLGKTVGVSSTAERRIGSEQVTSHLTTPEAPELHALLARMFEESVGAVIIEVSAHALTRHRIDGVFFDVVAFTNLSHDHLDDYPSLDDYLAAKIELFDPARARHGVVSLDSEAGAVVVERSGIPVSTIVTAPGASMATADWVVTVTDEQPDNTEFTVTHEHHGSVSCRIPIIGRHMASNAGLAIAMLVEGGISLDEIRSAVALTGQIAVELPGRLVRVSGASGPTVYVDSGHTPDAFAKTLEAIRAVTPGRVIMVTGADGGRDPSKRHDMGREAMVGSDILIVTDHHSRFEDPAAIRAALVRGASDARPGGDVREIADPREAIGTAIDLAGEGDTVLWSGLASQDYRDVEGVEQPFSAIDIARDLAQRRFG